MKLIPYYLLLLFSAISFADFGSRFELTSSNPYIQFNDSALELEWILGPDLDADWNDVDEWVEELGNGWRLPTYEELYDIHSAGIHWGVSYGGYSWWPFDAGVIWSSSYYISIGGIRCYEACKFGGSGGEKRGGSPSERCGYRASAVRSLR